MKTRLLFLVLILSTVFTACSKDDDGVDTKLITNELSIKSGHTSQIVIEPNGEGYMFTSDNDLIASVKTTGEVKGVIIGETSISISNPQTGFNGKCKVVVTPQYQMYKEPYMKFGATINEIKAYETRKIISEASTNIGYEGENSKVAIVGYILENSRLKSSCVLVPFSSYNVDLLTDFIGERYIVELSDKNILFYSIDKKIGGGISVYTYGGAYFYMVVYIEFPTQSRSVNSDIFVEIKNQIENERLKFIIHND